MASNAVRSLLRQTAQEYDLLFPDRGLCVPDFLLKDRHGDLQPGWRARFETIVSNEWAVTEKIFSERPYQTVVEIRDQLRVRLESLAIAIEATDEHTKRLESVCEAIEVTKSKHGAPVGLRDALGEASPRSNAGKLGWSLNAEKDIY